MELEIFLIKMMQIGMKLVKITKNTRGVMFAVSRLSWSILTNSDTLTAIFSETLLTSSWQRRKQYTNNNKTINNQKQNKKDGSYLIAEEGNGVTNEV